MKTFDERKKWSKQARRKWRERKEKRWNERFDTREKKRMNSRAAERERRRGGDQSETSYLTNELLLSRSSAGWRAQTHVERVTDQIDRQAFVLGWEAALNVSRRETHHRWDKMLMKQPSPSLCCRRTAVCCGKSTTRTTRLITSRRNDSTDLIPWVPTLVVSVFRCSNNSPNNDDNDALKTAPPALIHSLSHQSVKKSLISRFTSNLKRIYKSVKAQKHFVHINTTFYQVRARPPCLILDNTTPLSKQYTTCEYTEYAV